MEEDTTKTGIEYREYRDGDEKAIIDLFNFVFKRSASVDDWRWAYLENPVNRRDIVLAFSGSQLVGQSAATPLTYLFRGSVVKATRTQNVMVHPEFQGRGIFTRTLKRLTDELYEKRLDLVVTFPNNNSLPTFLRKLDYSHVDDIVTYQMPAGALPKTITTDITMTIAGPESIDKADHDFIHQCLAGYEIFNYRSLEYLQWRFSSRSGKRYHVLRACHNGDPAALVIFKYYPDAQGVDLVEFFTKSRDPSVIASILVKIRDFYAAMKMPVGAFGIWLFSHYGIFSAFTKNGFAPSNFSTHVVSKSFSPVTSQGFDLRTSYYLAMGDSDVY